MIARYPQGVSIRALPGASQVSHPVFIASPGDLAEERRAFKETVDEPNKGFSRRADVEFVPLGTTNLRVLRFGIHFFRLGGELEERGLEREAPALGTEPRAGRQHRDEERKEFLATAQLCSSSIRR